MASGPATHIVVLVAVENQSVPAATQQGPNPPEVVLPGFRPAYEAQQQPRRLLDASATQSVDSPIPATNEALQQICWLRRRHDYEAEQQPRRLLDVGTSQSVDNPIPNAVPLELTLRSRWPYQAPRGLPVDVLAPAVTPDNPTGAPFAQWVGRPPAWEQWLQARLVDTSYTRSVDSPPGIAAQQGRARQSFTAQQARLLPVDVLAPAVTPDPPPGSPTQQVPYLRAVSPVYWQDRATLDVSVTQSVDAPPGFFIQQPARRDLSLTQWHQPSPGPLSTPDNPGPPPFQAAAYMRAAAARQAYQKTYSALLLVTVESPPTQGPFQPAIYRRPVPPAPYRLPSTSVMVAPPPPPVDLAPYMAAATERFFAEARERFQADARDRYTDGGQP